MKYNIQQSFIEIRSTNSIDIQQNLNKFISFSSTNPQFFNNGNYDIRNNTCVFRQNDNSFDINFQSNRIIINFNNNKQQIDITLNTIINILNIVFSENIYSYFNRVGVRFFIAYSYKSAQEITNIIKNKFFNIETLDNISNKIDNLGIKFSLPMKDFKINCGVNPAITQEIKFKNSEPIELTHTHNLILDLDLYKEGSLSTDNIIKFCNDTKDNFKSIINKAEGVLS